MDWKCIRAIRRKANLSVVWYFIYQYCLHVKGVKIVSSRVYRVLRSHLLWNWEEIDHPLKPILDREDVMVDILFSQYEASYPKAIVTCGKLYLKEFEARKEL